MDRGSLNPTQRRGYTSTRYVRRIETCTWMSAGQHDEGRPLRLALMLGLLCRALVLGRRLRLVVLRRLGLLWLPPVLLLLRLMILSLRLMILLLRLVLSLRLLGLRLRDRLLLLVRPVSVLRRLHQRLSRLVVEASAHRVRADARVLRVGHVLPAAAAALVGVAREEDVLRLVVRHLAGLQRGHAVGPGGVVARNLGLARRVGVTRGLGEAHRAVGAHAAVPAGHAGDLRKGLDGAVGVGTHEEVGEIPAPGSKRRQTGFARLEGTYKSLTCAIVDRSTFVCSPLGCSTS